MHPGCGPIRALAGVAFLLVQPAARAQLEAPLPLAERRDLDPPRTATGPTQTPVNIPKDTEVMQTERVAPLPQGPVTVPLEEPLNPDKYICGRGDVFDVNFWGQQNFRVRVTVDPEGRTFVPKVGYVDVVGRTLAQARIAMRAAIHRFYPGLNADISLAAPRSFLVHVVGFVPKPGVYTSNPVQRVGALLAGALVTGSRRRIGIIHRDGSRSTADLVLYETTGDTRHNPFLMDGDVIDVPFIQVSVTIAGPVRRPGRYELIETKDIEELLSLAGGFNSQVTRRLPVRLTRRDSNEHTTELKIPFAADGTMPNQPLRDDDIVTIPGVQELQRSITVIGPVAGATAADDVTAVKRLPFVEGATVRSVMETIGPVGSSADLKSAYIRKGNGKIVPVDMEALLTQRDFTADRPLEMGDTLTIPQKRRSVAVEGAVLRPGLYPYNPQFGASEYLTVAGGPSKNARGEGTFRLITSKGRESSLTRALKIDPGDTISVPERTFSRAEVVQLVLTGLGLVVSSISAFTLVYVLTK